MASYHASVNDFARMRYWRGTGFDDVVFESSRMPRSSRWNRGMFAHFGRI
jgi:hypothetical protein